MKKFIGLCMVILLLSIIFTKFTNNTSAEPEEPIVTIIEETESVPEVIMEQISEKKKPETYQPVITDSEEGSAVYIWNELSKHSPSDQITAGIMGYFWRESKFRSNAVAGWHIRNVGRDRDICEEFTEIVDSGLHNGSTKQLFVETVSVHYGGYGLGQWLSPGYLEHFYAFVQEKNGSIGDAAIQCEFIFESLQRNEELWHMLLECETAAETGRLIAIWYDGASWEGVSYISELAHDFYQEFVKE